MALASAQMQTVSTHDGVAIAVHDLGGSGRPLLLAHATGFVAQMWAKVAERLTDTFHVIAFDTRGHGDSSRPRDPEGFDWRCLAADVLAVVDELDLTPALAAGHSSGGAALLLAEIARPGTFDALFLYEPIVFPPPEAGAPPQPNVMAEAARRRRAWFPSRDAAFANYSTKPPLASLHPDVLRAYVEHGFRDGRDGGIELKCAPEDEAAVFARARGHDAFDRLGEVRCDVAVAGGEESDIPPDLMHLIARRLPKGRAEVVPGKGHLLPFEEPDVVAALVRAALGPGNRR